MMTIDSQTKQKRKITGCSLLLSNCRGFFFLLEFLKLFLRTGGFGDLEYVESNGFTQWSTFTNSDYVTDLHVTRRERVANSPGIPKEKKKISTLPKTWTEMNGHILVTFLESIVFANVV